MRKISLVGSNGEILGMGYMGNSQEDENCLAELRRQIDLSRIRAELRFEETDTIDKAELGEQMADFRECQDCLKRLNNNETLEQINFSGYNIMDLLGRQKNKQLSEKTRQKSCFFFLKNPSKLRATEIQTTSV